MTAGAVSGEDGTGTELELRYQRLGEAGRGYSGWKPGINEPTANAAMVAAFDLNYHFNFDSPYHSSVHSLIL